MTKYLIFLFFVLSFSIHAQQKNEAYHFEIMKYRDARVQSFLSMEDGPLTEQSARGVEYFSIDENYNLKCSIQRLDEDKPEVLDTYSGKTKEYKKYGVATCPIGDNTLQFSLYQYQKYINHPVYKNNLFLPYKDLTNGETSYGGGRYIDLKIEDIQDNFIWIDLNKAYNPWCAYSAGYNCTIPPIENHLDISLPYGESAFKGKYKK